MKSLTHYIQEKLVIKKRKIVDYKYFPKTNKELKNVIKKRIKEEGNEVDLNDIDVSKITDMSWMFEGTNFNGDISRWDVSNVTDMGLMFYTCSNFNSDISDWDVSNVKDMSWMFAKCSKFNQNISNWNVSKVTDNDNMFDYCPIEEKYKPKFK